MTIQSIVIIGLIKLTSMQSIYSEKEHSCASGQKTHLLWIPCIFCVSFSEVERTIYLKIYIHTKKESMSRHTEQQCEQDNLIFHVHAFVYIYLRDIS